VAFTESRDTPAAAAAAPAAATESPAVWCDGVAKAYDGRPALDGVALTVRRGEVLGLLGPNGAGKTTLIKILLGLVRADAGEVRLLGRDASRPEARQRVGYLPELFRFQPWLTADEVLRLHGQLGRVPTTREGRRAGLDRVGLADRADDRVAGFSKGMQQRLGLAVALLGEPELVVLDEPTSALDPVGRADVRAIVVALRAQGVALLLNSHLIGEVERVCDRITILDRGRVAAEGTLDDLLGEGELRLRLGAAGADVAGLLGRYGEVHVADGWTVLRGAAPDVAPQVVRELVAQGVDVYAVEPTRITLEERLLSVLRHDAEAAAEGDRR
jgi:ABC-2 type transport system ATP-binding protein